MNTYTDMWISKRGIQYQKAENEKYIVWYTGVLIADNSPVQNPLEVAKKAYENQLDYNLMSGCYKLVIFSKTENGYLFFGDHAGNQFFFFDEREGVFSDSFLELRKKREREIEIDMVAAFELIELGRILGEKTLIRDIKKTDADRYYRLRNGKIEIFPKGLRLLSEMVENIQLDDVVAPMLKTVEAQKICAVCTGGTDSRVIISNLLFREQKPDLLLTGHSDNPDVPIAEKIARKAELPLALVQFSEHEEDWLKKSFCFMDGMYDVVLGYRHLMKAKHVAHRGYTVEFGGVGGEFYKNSFYLPFRRAHIRDKQRQIELVLAGNGVSRKACFGDELRDAAKTYLREVGEINEKAKAEHGLLAVCNSAGFELLKSGAGSITNAYSAVCCKVDPLMDRRLIAVTSKKAAWTLSMHMWQRKQIARYCPTLSDIPTDQGYSCSVNMVVLLKERWKKLRFYSGRVVARLQRKMGLQYRDASAHYWDSDYMAARQDPSWKFAIEKCKELGVLQKDANDEEIPIAKTGEILQIGLLFAEDFDKGMHCVNFAIN